MNGIKAKHDQCSVTEVTATLLAHKAAFFFFYYSPHLKIVLLRLECRWRFDKQEEPCRSAEPE